MELTKEISGERLPQSHHGSMANLISSQENLSQDTLAQMSDEEITTKAETILLKRVELGDKQALFQLGQLYFEQNEYERARSYFEKAAECGDYQAVFQLGVIHYDGVAGPANHKLGLDYMLQIAKAETAGAKHLKHPAQYNIGRAYFQGYGVVRSDEEAEKWWLLAADDGNPKASIKAQSMLGMFYCGDDKRDLKQAFFWHSEACGNGSLESQGALGVMYLHGLGIKKDLNAAFECLREASSRGNVYAMGNLVGYYYKRKLYTKTVELASRVATFENVEKISLETDCIADYIAKGIAMACFYYGRCLHHGYGVKKDHTEAKRMYSRSFYFDPDVCAQLQNVTTHGAI